MRPRYAVRNTTWAVITAVVCVVGATGCMTAEQQLFSHAEESLYANQFAEADSLFTAYIALEPSAASAWYNRALARAGRDDVRNAMTDLDRAVQLAPGDLDARWFRFRLREVWIGHLRADTSGPDLTRPLRTPLISALEVIQIQELSAFLVNDPENATARCERAIIYRRTGRNDEARADLDRILKIEPHDVRALTERGNLAHALARYEDALMDYAAAMGSCDTCLWLLYNSALSLQAAGRLAEAVTVLEKLVAADSVDGEAWFMLGECRLALRRPEAACDAWRRSAALGIDEARERLTTFCR